MSNSLQLLFLVHLLHLQTPLHHVPTSALLKHLPHLNQSIKVIPPLRQNLEVLLLPSHTLSANLCLAPNLPTLLIVLPVSLRTGAHPDWQHFPTDSSPFNFQAENNCSIPPVNAPGTRPEISKLNINWQGLGPALDSWQGVQKYNMLS